MFIDTSASHSSHPAGNTGAKLRKLAETVERLYSRNARRSLEKIISKVYPADIASVLSIIPEEHVAAIFHAIPDTTFATDVLTQVNDRVQRRILAETPDSQLITVLEKLPPDKRTLLIRELE
ncbi:MAG: hypothetical protein KDI35_10245, partial [Gammaproteobacteria bacterium]|nr:hypothetical protein [Gammaproteobacteria bacterium]